MKLKGGYDVCIAGRPDGSVQAPPEPSRLAVPLRSRRLAFTEVCVSQGQRVRAGDVLAKAPGVFGLPLLAARAGVVRLGEVPGHIILTDLACRSGPDGRPEAAPRHAPKDGVSQTARCESLVALGAWSFFCDALTGGVPDPTQPPAAVIVSTLALEPYVARGDAQLSSHLSAFARGLEQLQSLLEYQPIYLVLPDLSSRLGEKVHDMVRGYAWVKTILIRPRYPYDDFALLARRLGLGKAGCIWGLRVEGVLAVDQALTNAQPCLDRVVAVGGPATSRPTHLRVPVGYPIEEIVGASGAGGEVRVINGGALTGRQVGPDGLGIDAECTGLTVLAEQTRRELFGFAWPGWTRNSYSKWFLSALRGPFLEEYTTGLRGERRPCVACGLCEEVCPAGIMPHLIHKYLYQDSLEDAEAAGTDLCVGCGLCTYVCPSKIELRQQILDGRELIRRELHSQEADGPVGVTA